MERTAGDVIRPPALEGDEITYDLDNLCSIENLVYGILRNHPYRCRISSEGPEFKLFFMIFHVLHSCKRRRDIVIIIIGMVLSILELDLICLPGLDDPEH